jgi:hypothetical protein
MKIYDLGVLQPNPWRKIKRMKLTLKILLITLTELEGWYDITANLVKNMGQLFLKN